MLLCTFKAKITTCKIIEYVFKTLSEVVISTPTSIHKCFFKPQILHTTKYCKTSNGILSKKYCYTKWNCKSGRHGHRHTFMKRKSLPKHTATNNSNQGLKIRGKKLGTFKSPLLEDLIVCSKPSMIKKIAKILTILNIILHHSASLTCARITYPWNKIKMIGFPSASPRIVSFDMFFQIPTHSMIWIHGRRLYDHPRNQGV